MSHDDDDEQARYRTRGEQIRARNAREPDPEQRRGPYEAHRPVRTFEDDDPAAAAHPWQAAHPQDRDDFPRTRPRPGEQPARYGGAYRADEPGWQSSRDGRHGAEPRHERPAVQGYQNEDNWHRAHGYERGAERGEQAWRGQRAFGHGHTGQNNSGYDREREYGQGRDHDDARSDLARASWTQEHDYQGPRYGATNRRDSPSRGEMGRQDGHTDTHGSAGFRQQGKRYWFDESDQRAGFRGTAPRGYQRSDERLRELACERLTEADLDASDIEVKVSQGVVTLEGSVRARWMKHQAEDIIDDLGGVKDIQNKLRVGSASEASTAPAAPNVGISAPPGGAGSGPTTGSGGGGGNGPLGGDTGGRSKH